MIHWPDPEGTFYVGRYRIAAEDGTRCNTHRHHQFVDSKTQMGNLWPSLGYNAYHPSSITMLVGAGGSWIPTAFTNKICPFAANVYKFILVINLLASVTQGKKAFQGHRNADPFSSGAGPRSLPLWPVRPFGANHTHIPYAWGCTWDQVHFLALLQVGNHFPLKLSVPDLLFEPLTTKCSKSCAGLSESPFANRPTQLFETPFFFRF